MEPGAGRPHFRGLLHPRLLTTSTGAAPSRTRCSPRSRATNHRPAQFPRRYTAQLQAYRQAYGGQMNEQLLRQLGIDRQILQQLVDEEAMVAEARRQSIRSATPRFASASSTCRRSRRTAQFIGEQRYRQMLQFNNPPLHRRRVRGQPARAADGREAAHRASPAGLPSPTPKWQTSTAAATKR